MCQQRMGGTMATIFHEAQVHLPQLCEFHELTDIPIRNLPFFLVERNLHALGYGQTDEDDVIQFSKYKLMIAIIDLTTNKKVNNLPKFIMIHIACIIFSVL